jgi:hypothetical protein
VPWYLILGDSHVARLKYIARPFIDVKTVLYPVITALLNSETACRVVQVPLLLI